jgi:hypothetical protein
MSISALTPWAGLQPAKSRRKPPTWLRPIAAAAAFALVLVAGCAGGGEETSSSQASPAPTASATETPEPAAEAASTSDAVETSAATSRIAIAYDGGIQVRDATSLELVADIPLDGFLRVNPAGDGRHVLVTREEQGFQLFDLGVWASAHGDHYHYYAADPELTDVVYPAAGPGHVVPHDGRTALFDDGTGHVQIVDAHEFEEGLGAVAREYTTPSPHHGVAVELPSGELVVSAGTEEGRTGIRVLDAAGGEIAALDECPGLHGEAVSADEAVTFGCADGVLMYREGQITKIAAPDPAGATSSMSSVEGSAVALGNYSVEDSGPARVALVDTAKATERTVEIPAGYGHSSLGRLEDGTALVLGMDGSLHVIDVEAATVTASHPVIEAWEEPDDWQAPTPRLMVLGDMAYVLDATAGKLLVVDPVTGEIWKQTDLGVTPGEIAGVDGTGPGAHDHADGDEDEHADEE